MMGFARQLGLDARFGPFSLDAAGAGYDPIPPGPLGRERIARTEQAIGRLAA